MNHSPCQTRLASYQRLRELGVSHDDLLQLSKIERLLRRWSELERSGHVEYDEVTGEVLRSFTVGRGQCVTRVGRNLQRGALRRVSKIMQRYPELWFYHHPSGPGCALYVGKNTSALNPTGLTSLLFQDWIRRNYLSGVPLHSPDVP